MPEFRPPPGGPPTPPGWLPPAGWSPDPAWPPAPPGWQFSTTGPGRRRLLTWPRTALAAGLAVVLVVVGIAAVRALTGHESFDVVENGFAYRVTIAEVTRPAEANGLIARPGYDDHDRSCHPRAVGAPC